MNKKQFTILTLLLLLVVGISSSACSTTRINAQNPRNNTETARTENSDSTPAYKPPKRISKDVIKTEEKTEKTTKNKQKK